MSESLSFQIRNSFGEIPAANEAVSRWLAARKVPAAVDYLANLAIEELATNSIKYGHDDAAEHQIEFELTLGTDEMVLVMMDDGRPFNPLELPEPDTSLPVEDRPVGGLGVHLLRKMSDSMQYERLNGRNRITLRKSLAP